MQFTLQEPLVFAENSTEAFYPKIAGLYHGNIVRFPNGEDYMISSDAERTRFLRRSAFYRRKWYHAQWLPDWFRRLVAPPVPVLVELSFPTGTVGFIIGGSYAEGSSHPIQKP